MKVRNNIFIFFASTIFFGACESADEDNYVPRPVALNHIALPEPEYVKVDDGITPYIFEYSKHAVLIDDTVGLHEDFWKKLDYGIFGSEVDITYKAINNSPERLDSLIRDAYKLVDEHSVKAEAINYKEITLANGFPATIFNIKGEVPTTFQFFTHDSTNHFLRCSLYFPTALKNDSLQPVIEYCIQDMHHLMNTLKWR